MLTLVLADSAIELVPNEIADHPSIQATARRKNKDASQLILDQNYHHPAILKLKKNRVGRGRPDIAQHCLLLAQSSPLNMEHQLKCFVHTRDDQVIDVEPSARLPRNSERFVSLLEQLYQESKVPTEGLVLMTLKHLSLRELLDGIHPSRVTALTREGIRKTMPEVASEMAVSDRPVVLVGGFSEGHFSPQTLQSVSVKYSIDSRSLEASTVVARAVYDYETAIGLERFPVQRN